MAKKVIPWKLKSITLESYNANGVKQCTDSYTYEEDKRPECETLNDVHRTVSKRREKLINGSYGYAKIITIRSNKSKIVTVRM